MDDKKNIHVNPDFINKRDETQVMSKVHINPAFFHKKMIAHESSSRTINNASYDVPRGQLLPVIQSSALTRPAFNQNYMQVSVPSDGKVHSVYSHCASHNSATLASTSSFKSNVMSSSSRLLDQIGSSQSGYSQRRSMTNSQVYHSNATKPSSYAWRNSTPLGCSNITTHTSHVLSCAPASTSTVRTAISSNFQYQSKDVLKNRLSKANTTEANPQGNRFKVDHRLNDQPLVRRPSLITCDPKTQSAVETSYANPHINLSLESVSMKRDLKASSLDSSSRTNLAVRESSKKGISKQSIMVQGDSDLNSCENSLLITQCNKIKTQLNSADDNLDSIDACSKSAMMKLPSGETENVKVANSSANKHKDLSKEPMGQKCSNILINPILLKSLSKNDNIDIVAIASKSGVCKGSVNVDSQCAKNNAMIESPRSIPKYNVISKTNLVRQRTRSFSKDKQKAFCLNEGRLPLESTTMCRPCSVFPTRFPGNLTKANPRRRSVVISRMKLIRRLSGSSSSSKDGHEKHDYSIKTKTKLVKKMSNIPSKSPRLLHNYSIKTKTKLVKRPNTPSNCLVPRRLELISPKPNMNTKNKYSLISKTKLVRRRSNSGSTKTRGVRDLNAKNVQTLIRRHKLVRGTTSQKSSRIYLPKKLDFKHRRINTKYKIENRDGGLSAKQKAARGIVSKYRINKLKVDTPSVRQIGSRRFCWTSSKGKDHHPQQMPVRRRGSEKFSDRIVNIGGILYKATKTSLQKQTAKKKHVTESRRGSKCIVKLHGNQYCVSAGGRTLTRLVKRAVTPSGPSLSRVHIGGLTYSRTKTGHYELTRVHQARAVLSFAKQRSVITLSQGKKRGLLRKCNQYCLFYNRFGRCTKKDKGDCPYLHDPKRIAICTRFLRGRCPVSNCPFSHEIDPDKMPVCSHFVRSICTRDNCPYRHVMVNPNAPLCLGFIHGHCPLGQECKNQHVLECKEFITAGKCPRGKACPLSHRTGHRKKRKSVSLEPASATAGSSAHHGSKTSLSKRRKSKDYSSNALDGHRMSKKENKHIKSLDSQHKRYFQVSDRVFVSGENVNDDIESMDKPTEAMEIISAKESVMIDGKEKKPQEEERDSSSTLYLGDKLSCFDLVEEFRKASNESISEMAKKRVQVLKKIEKMKLAYESAGNGSDGEKIRNRNERTQNKSSEEKIIDDKHILNDDKQIEVTEKDRTKEVESESALDFKCDAYERRPLPKKMPSYISLTKETCDVEDL